jgi:hypothetical protein
MASAAPWRSRIVGHADVSPSVLVPNPENWRAHPQEQRDALGGALEEVGWVTEVIVNKTTGNLVDGHLRLDLALSRNEPFVPVTYVELTQDEERLVLATLDPLAAMADAEVIPLQELLAQLDPNNAALRDVLANLGEQYDTKRPSLTDQDAEPYLNLIRAVVGAMVPMIREGRLVAWNVGVSPKTHHFDHAMILRDAGLRYIRQIVWAKSGVAFPIWQYTDGRARKYHPNYTHEMIYLFSLGEPEPGAATSIDAEYSRDVWEIHQSTASVGLPGVTDGRRPRKDGVHGGSKINTHPAMYPVAIPAGPIRHLTAPGETTYDPFVGSGTTIIAAEQLNRRCYAMEIDPRYVAVAIKRWEDFTGESAVQQE